MSSELEGRGPQNPGKSPLFSAKNEGRPSPFPIEMEKFKLAGWDIVESEASNKPPQDTSKTRDFTLNSGIPVGPGESAALRSKSSQRMRYEAEVNFIKRKLGDLESIRQKLGLTQRKMCQLLLVDPSAWTRWTRDGEDAPPHIYRMLQWYLALEEKYPALDVNFWLSTVAQVQAPQLDAERDQKIDEIGTQVSELKGETARLAEEIQTGVHASLERVFEKKLKGELEAARKASRRQNLIVILAAILGSLIAGFLASRFM